MTFNSAGKKSITILSFVHPELLLDIKNWS
jgi:hypothetical protein